MLEIFGTLVGLLYLWLEYRASIYVWVTGIIMPAIYIVVYYNAGLYADCGINVYYVLAAVYGVAMWKRSTPLQPSPQGEGEFLLPSTDDKCNTSFNKGNNITLSPAGEGRGGVQDGIIHTPRHLWPRLAAAFLLLWVAIGAVLIRFTDSTVPWWDAFTTALSIVAMYMLAHKHAEQWLAWIVVDLVCCGLYMYKDLHATSLLYGLYTVIAIFGYRKWCKMATPSPCGEGWGGVILAAGDFPTHPIPASLLDHPRVVCCDSAAEAFIASGRTPYAVVGDGDSLGEDTKRQVHFIHVKDQETNDLTKAVQWAVTAPGDSITGSIAIIGATGKREDHSLGNISLLIDYMHMGIDVQMITDHGIFVPCHGTRTFPATGNRQEISIFNFTCTQLTGEGLDYPLRPFTNWWQGTLNYTNAPSFTIHADGDYLVFLSFSFHK